MSTPCPRIMATKVFGDDGLVAHVGFHGSKGSSLASHDRRSGPSWEASLVAGRCPQSDGQTAGSGL